jgi:hypothetical protein
MHICIIESLLIKVYKDTLSLLLLHWLVCVILEIENVIYLINHHHQGNELNITMEIENRSYDISSKPRQSITPDKILYDISSREPPILTTTIRNSKKDPKDLTDMDLIAEKLEKKNNEHNNSEKNKSYEITEENYLLKNIPNKGFLLGSKSIGGVREKALKGPSTRGVCVFVCVYIY